MIVDFPSKSIGPDLMRHYFDLKTLGSKRRFYTIFKNLAETMYYSHCFCCNGLQVADFIVGALNNFLKTEDERFVKIISRKFRRSGLILKGYGLALYPKDLDIWDKYLLKLA